MADQYQIPGAFQAPSMAEISYVSGQGGLGGDAQWNQFTQQVNAYTNINNANRLRSLREKEFARQIVENDRDFDLRREAQDANIRNGDLNYEISRFTFEKNKEQYNQLQDAWSNYPKLREEIANLLPNGGNIPNWGRVRSQIRSQYAKNPAQAVLLDQILLDYDRENKIYSDNKVLEDQAQVQSWLEGGDFLIDEVDDQGNVVGSKPIMIGDRTAEEVYSEALMEYNRGNQVGYLAKMAPLKRIGLQRQQMREAAQTIQQAGAIEKATGVPIYQFKATEKGIETIFQPARTRGAGAGVSQIASAAKAYANIATDLGEEAKVLQDQVAGMEDGLEKTALEARIASKLREQQYFSDLARQTATQSQPIQGVPAGQTTKTPGASGVLGTPPSKAPKIKDFKTPSAPQPQVPTVPQTMEKTAGESTFKNTKGKAPYLIAGGKGKATQVMWLTDSEVEARRKRGENPVRTEAPNPEGAPVKSSGLAGTVSG